MPSAISVPVSEFADIYEELRLLEKVKLHIDTGSVLLHLTMKLPQAAERNGIKIIAQTGSEMSVTSLVFSENIYAVFLVREQLGGNKESLSVAFVGEDEKIALSIYMCRSDENTIEERSKKRFEALWNKYKK